MDFKYQTIHKRMETYDEMDKKIRKIEGCFEDLERRLRTEQRQKQ